MKAYKRTKCLVPNCSHEGHCRGLCANHYNQATAMVRLNRTTWEELIKNGKCTGPAITARNQSWLLDFKKGKE